MDIERIKKVMEAKKENEWAISRMDINSESKINAMRDAMLIEWVLDLIEDEEFLESMENIYIEKNGG